MSQVASFTFHPMMQHVSLPTPSWMLKHGLNGTLDKHTTGDMC